MKILLVGSSSQISEKIKKKLKFNFFGISTSKLKAKKIFNINSYNKTNINKAIAYFKNKNLFFDAVIFFNGFHKSSLYTFFNEELFNQIIKKNFTIPLRINSLLITNKLLKKNCSIIFVGSIASELDEIGNAYYSSAKSMLEKAMNIPSPNTSVAGSQFFFPVRSTGTNFSLFGISL